MDENIATRIQEYISTHCNNQFPPDRFRQINLLHQAGFTRLRTGSGNSFLSMELCAQNQIYRVARRTYSSAVQELEKTLSDQWPEPQIKYGEGCSCLGYSEE